MNCYAVLGIPRNAGYKEIRTAFRQLAKRYHPDAGAESSPEKFREITEAYATLTDPARRHAHDLMLATRPGRH